MAGPLGTLLGPSCDPQKSPDTPGSPEGKTEGPGTASSEPLLPSLPFAPMIHASLQRASGPKESSVRGKGSAPGCIPKLLLRRQGSQVSMRVARGSASWLSSPDGYFLEPTEWPKGSQASCGVWMRREGREPLPDHAGESPLLSRSGGEKGLRGSGAGTLGLPLGGTRHVGGRLEALVPSLDSRAMTRSPSPRVWRPDLPGAA